MTKHRCRACDSSNVKDLVDFGSLPITHRLLRSKDEAEERFAFHLSLCNDCGLIQSVEPIDPEVLYSGYNFNFSSWKAEPHMPDEIATIRSAAKIDSIFEIGCNDGTFLDLLCDGRKTLRVGVEPNPVPGKVASERGIEVHRSMLNQSICKEITAKHGQFDLVVARQVIEHVLDLEEFFASIRLVLKPDGRLFLDMPDIEPSLTTGDVSTLWEEHVSYFSEPSLLRLLRRHGFEPVQFKRYDFSGGALSVLARRSDTAGPGEPLADIEPLLKRSIEWVEKVRLYTALLVKRVEEARRINAEVVLYGVGVRGCMALNCLKVGHLFDYAVDDQPQRQGLFMPGSRLAIQPSANLSRSDRPVLVVLAVNNESEERVINRVLQGVTRPVQFVSLCSPKDIFEELSSSARSR